ncbi:MAG: hypothetical protein N3H84_00630 [Candidatus Caldarchaeum sp.]|nr:hypothetical protein [Candidatus Caldarchaeum sp.]
MKHFPLLWGQNLPKVDDVSVEQRNVEAFISSKIFFYTYGPGLRKPPPAFYQTPRTWGWRSFWKELDTPHSSAHQPRETPGPIL